MVSANATSASCHPTNIVLVNDVYAIQQRHEDIMSLNFHGYYLEDQSSIRPSQTSPKPCLAAQLSHCSQLLHIFRIELVDLLCPKYLGVRSYFLIQSKH